MKLGLVLGVCLCVLGCSSDSEEDGGSTGGATGTGGTGTGGTGAGGGDAGDGCGNFCTASECCSCSETQCTTPYEACRCEPECVELIDCIRSCPQSDLTCQEGCFLSRPIGAQVYKTLENCAAKFCTVCLSGPGDAGAD
jgi:hypothetical protein